MIDYHSLLCPNDSTSITYPTLHEGLNCTVTPFALCGPPEITITNYGNVDARVHIVAARLNPNPLWWLVVPPGP